MPGGGKFFTDEVRGLMTHSNLLRDTKSIGTRKILNAKDKVTELFPSWDKFKFCPQPQTNYGSSSSSQPEVLVGLAVTKVLASDFVKSRLCLVKKV